MEQDEYHVNGSITIFDCLYSRDSTNGFKFWLVSVEDPHAAGVVHLCRTYGKVGGSATTKKKPITKGTNLGKSNARNQLEQAQFEALSEYRDKRKEGYKSLADLGCTEVLEGNRLTAFLASALPRFNTDNNDNIKPMKAQPYYSKTNRIVIKFPCYGQPKMNGFRCVAKLEMGNVGTLDFPEVKFRSKEGKSYQAPHIANTFLPEHFRLDPALPEVIFDGELYIPGALLQDINSIVTNDTHLRKHELQFHIFDIAVPDVSQDQRIQYLTLLKSKIAGIPNSPIVIVETHYIQDDAQAQVFTDAMIAVGHEGGIFRDMNATYKFGQRPSTMVKLKREKDTECVILDVILPEDGNPAYSVLLCQNDLNDETFKCSIEGGFEFRTALYEQRDAVRGNFATVKFYERTDRDVPFHAIATLIHNFNQ